MNLSPIFSGIYKLLFETVGEGLIIVDRSGKILLANPRAREMFGYTSEDFMGLEIEALIPQKVREKHHSHREDFHKHPRKRRMGQNMNLQALRKDGNQFDVEISLNHFKEDNEVYVVAVITDVTERVKQ